MNRMSEATSRLPRLLLQQLESLERAGVKQLPRRPAPSVSTSVPRPSTITETPPAPEETGMAPAPKDASAPSKKTRTRSVPLPADDAVTEPRGRPAKSKSAADTLRDLAVIQREVAACRRCEHLACTRTQTVFGVGNCRPRLCFMGEAPGADEDRQGEPFVGRAGQLLTDIIQKAMGLQRSDVYILNVLKCRPPNNRVPTEEEVANCREYFERQLEVLQPEFICCLGATAVRGLLNKTTALGRLRGQWFEYRGARVIVTYHPSYLLRNPPAKKDTWADIQLLMREMGLPLPNRDP